LETVNDTLESKLNPLTIEEVDIFTIKILECLESLEDIPKHYWDSLDMFNSEKVVSTLPELQGPNIDFLINLKPDKPLLKLSCPYHMNQEECAECWKVLDQMLSAGWAEPADSNCPIATPMFFVWKKDGTC
jgi:hypothetical protein